MPGQAEIGRRPGGRMHGCAPATEDGAGSVPLSSWTRYQARWEMNSCPGRAATAARGSAARSAVKWCAADPGPRFLVAKTTGVPHLRCITSPGSRCARPGFVLHRVRDTSALSGLEPRDDLARNGLDLLHLVLVRNEDDLLRANRKVRLELLDALVDRPHDGAVFGRLAPGGKIRSEERRV